MNTTITLAGQSILLRYFNISQITKYHCSNEAQLHKTGTQTCHYSFPRWFKENGIHLAGRWEFDPVKIYFHSSYSNHLVQRERDLVWNVMTILNESGFWWEARVEIQTEVRIQFQTNRYILSGAYNYSESMSHLDFLGAHKFVKLST